MAPTAAFDEAPPPPEPFEQRGPMEDHPCYALRPPGSLAERLLKGLHEKGDELIQVYPLRLGDVRWTARALAARAVALAKGLVAVGVKPGDVVSMVGGSHPDYSPVLLATLRAGAAFAPLNHRFDDGDLRRLLDLTAPRVVLAVAEVAPRLRQLVSELQMEQSPTVLTLGEDEAWAALLTSGEDRELPPPPENPHDAVAVISCSSGTSGLPKGVVYTHAGIHALVDKFFHPELEVGASGTLIFTSPLFWVTGMWYTLLSMMIKDFKVICEYGATEEQFLQSIEEYRPCSIFTANNFLLSVAKVHEASSPRRDVSSLKMVLCGGAAMSQAADELVQRMFPGAKLLNMYGSTEINSAIGISKVQERKIGSVGKPGPFLRIKVVDVETGRALGPNCPGELRFKTPTATFRYYKNPTAELFDADGWVRSGDLGLYDEDGFFFITGRIKDTIKYRGVHVSPIELEGLLEGHPAVQESAVVGVPHPTDQELPRAYVALRCGDSVSAEELQALVQERLAEHKWLRGGVVFLPSLPKGGTGKISRAEIRRRYVTETL